MRKGAQRDASATTATNVPPVPDPSHMDGVTYLVEEWDAERLVIVTSTITRIEVLDSRLQ